MTDSTVAVAAAVSTVAAAPVVATKRQPLDEAIAKVAAQIPANESWPLSMFCEKVKAELPASLRPWATDARLSGKVNELRALALVDNPDGSTVLCTVTRGKRSKDGKSGGGVWAGNRETGESGLSEVEVAAKLAGKGADKIREHFAAISKKCSMSLLALGYSPDEVETMLVGFLDLGLRGGKVMETQMAIKDGKPVSKRVEVELTGGFAAFDAAPFAPKASSDDELGIGTGLRLSFKTVMFRFIGARDWAPMIMGY